MTPYVQLPSTTAVVFYRFGTNGLTADQSDKIERIQATCLKIIYGDQYIVHETALSISSLEKLSTRRDKRMLKFALKCTKDTVNMKFFPLNEAHLKKERFKVNFARTTAYMNSAIPQCQRMLNYHTSNTKV